MTRFVNELTGREQRTVARRMATCPEGWTSYQHAAAEGLTTYLAESILWRFDIPFVPAKDAPSPGSDRYPNLLAPDPRLTHNLIEARRAKIMEQERTLAISTLRREVALARDHQGRA